MQDLVISGLSLLHPAIERVHIVGKVRVMLTHSLLPLAAQPNLCAFLLDHSCAISTGDESWLHFAAFFHALLDRPTEDLQL